MPKHSDDGTKIMGKAGKVRVSIPIKDFVSEHKDLVKILEDDIKTKLMSEAQKQKKELKDVIERLSGSGLKPEDFKRPDKPNMIDEKVMKNMVDRDKMQEGSKFPFGKAPEGIPQGLWDERMRNARK